MMQLITLFLLLPIVIFAESYIDTKPGTVSKSDLELLKSFEKLSYDIADHSHDTKKSSIRDIVNFIRRHKTYSLDRNLWRLKVVSAGGYKSKTAYDNYNSGILDDREYQTGGVPYYKAGLQFEYPIIDEKEKQLISKSKLVFEQKVVSSVSDYFDDRTKLQSKKRLLELLRLKQRRSKVRQYAGVENLDDRIKIIEKILAAQEDIALLSVAVEKQKELLVSFVLLGYRSKLKSML